MPKITKARSKSRVEEYSSPVDYSSSDTDTDNDRKRSKKLKKANRKGPWTLEEDEKLRELVEESGPKDWSALATHIPGRMGKQCRERYYNHLAPHVKKDPWNQEEDEVIIKAHLELGNKWTDIAKILGNGRPANDIKNRWNSTLKKRSNPNEEGTATTTPHKSKTTRRVRRSSCEEDSEESDPEYEDDSPEASPKPLHHPLQQTLLMDSEDPEMEIESEGSSEVVLQQAPAPVTVNVESSVVQEQPLQEEEVLAEAIVYQPYVQTEEVESEDHQTTGEEEEEEFECDFQVAPQQQQEEECEEEVDFTQQIDAKPQLQLSHLQQSQESQVVSESPMAPQTNLSYWGPGVSLLDLDSPRQSPSTPSVVASTPRGYPAIPTQQPEFQPLMLSYEDLELPEQVDQWWSPYFM